MKHRFHIMISRCDWPDDFEVSIGELDGVLCRYPRVRTMDLHDCKPLKVLNAYLMSVCPSINKKEESTFKGEVQ